LDISQENFPKVGRGRPLYWAVKGRIVEKRIRSVLRQGDVSFATLALMGFLV
jgi:hypothetical protein